MMGHQTLHVGHIREMTEIQFNHIRILLLPVPAGTRGRQREAARNNKGNLEKTWDIKKWLQAHGILAAPFQAPTSRKRHLRQVSACDDFSQWTAGLPILLKTPPFCNPQNPVY